MMTINGRTLLCDEALNSPIGGSQVSSLHRRTQRGRMSPWVVLSLLLSCCIALGQRSSRLISLDQGGVWDPLLEDRHDRCALMVTPDHVGHCGVMLMELLDTTVKNRLNLFWGAFAGRYDSLYDSRSQWLDQADGSTQLASVEVATEVLNVLNGRLLPRPLCNNIHHLHSLKECRYYRELHDLKLIGLRVSSRQLLVNLAANIERLVYIVEDLFNDLQYDIAEGLAGFIMQGVLLPLMETEHYALNLAAFERALLKLGTMISEIERLRGYMEHSGTFTLLIHRAYLILSEHEFSSPELRTQALIQSMRAVAAIPSVPPDYPAAILLREEIETDLHRLHELIRRAGSRISIDDLQGVLSATPFYMAHQGLDDRGVQELLSGIWSTLCPELNYFSPHVQSALPLRTDQPLRIGFISTHFNDHSIGRILLETMAFMESHNWATLEKTLFVYSVTDVSFPDWESFQASDRYNSTKDYIDAQFASLFGNRLIRLPQSIRLCQRRIAADELDVLLFADVGMDFVTYALAFSRLASVQIAYWGHPITTGIPSIDYFFSLDAEVSLASTYYSEQMVRMDFINTIHLISPVFDAPRNYSLLVDVNMEPDARFALILGRLFKLHPHFLRNLAQLLLSMDTVAAEQPDTHLYLVFLVENVFDLNRMIYERLSAFVFRLCHDNGPLHDRVMRRVRFVDFGRYQSMSSLARAGIDTFPYGGCITAHDSFFAGLPLVTLPSPFVRGRYAVNLYQQMNFTSLVAVDENDFQGKILRLLIDDDYHRECRDRLRMGFQQHLFKNHLVAQEWSSFLKRLTV